MRAESIRLSEKCLSFANVFFTTMHLHTDVKPSLWNVAVFVSTERNGSYVIRQNKRCASIISSENERNFSGNLLEEFSWDVRDKCKYTYLQKRGITLTCLEIYLCVSTTNLYSYIFYIFSINEFITNVCVRVFE